MIPLPVAAILLAAGTASRMGELKQLLPFRGKTLLEHAMEQPAVAGFSPVVVVIGAQAETVRARIAAYRVAIVENRHWERGMGSSLAAGARCLRELQADFAAIAILLGDQPLVTARHLEAMRDLYVRSGSQIVAARYGEIFGVPAMFPRVMLSALESLPPDSGARTLLRDPDRNVIPFDLAEGSVDVDTPADFAALSEIDQL